ncbi:PASTA domain-containing protein [Streptomyces sp. NPDC058256]|uniref:PASTA domain-containing protein n=1 Tax=Streptomyces sp. NPDC058256 TaxID=3346408 RepID=UPI0036E53AE3
MRKGSAVLTVVIVVALVALSQQAQKRTAELPDLRGMTLREAQTAARKAGFNRLASEDAHYSNRIPLRGSNWKVCSQQPPPARLSLTTSVTLYVVKKGETC